MLPDGDYHRIVCHTGIFDMSPCDGKVNRDPVGFWPAKSFQIVDIGPGRIGYNFTIKDGKYVEMEGEPVDMQLLQNFIKQNFIKQNYIKEMI